MRLTARFYASASSIDTLPATPYPEVAFVGRSNVGKSSLLNHLFGQRLARVSRTPGCTRTFNFYLVQERWMWVDLPGLGYAAVARQQRHQWARLLRYYLEHRAQLHLTCVLIDSRHPPRLWDMAVMELLEHRGCPFVVVLTKSDHLSAAALQEQIAQLRTLLHACRYWVDIIPSSARTGQGREALIAVIRRYCQTPQ